MPVAIKAHLHNVCAKNNYELLIAQEPAEKNPRSKVCGGGGGGRERGGSGIRKMGASRADGGTTLIHSVRAHTHTHGRAHTVRSDLRSGVR